MKDIVIEQMLISAAPEQGELTAFTANTMEWIRLGASGAPKQSKNSGLHSLLLRVRRLHGVSLVLFILVLALGLGGITYAAIKFLPDLIGIDRKETNSRGQTEYIVTNFADCQRADAAQISSLKRFATVHGAPDTSDAEITKILQAKCELLLLDQVISQTWQHKVAPEQGRDYSQVTYARGNILAAYDSMTSDSIKTINWDTGEIQSYKIATDQKLIVLNRNEPMDPGDLKKGDAIMVVGEVIEISPNEPPLDGHVIGLIRLPLPVEYYTEKQRYITDIPECMGNLDELCPSTPSIDIYPRGEGMGNPFLPDEATIRQWQTREISGEVIEILGNQLKLKSFSNNIYHVSLHENGISDYNNHYSTVYIQQGTDAKVRVGSVVSVYYLQPPGSNPKVIQGDQIMQLKLLLKGVVNPKIEGLKEQY